MGWRKGAGGEGWDERGRMGEERVSISDPGGAAVRATDISGNIRVDGLIESTEQQRVNGQRNWGPICR